MIHLFSTSNFYFKKNPYQILDWALEKEFDGIELFADVPDFYGDNVDKKLLRKYSRASGKLKYNIHAPIYGINIGAVNPGILKESCRQIIKVMEWSKILDIQNFVIHLGTLPTDEEKVKKEVLKIVGGSIEKIMKNAKKYNIRVLIENIGLDKLYVDFELNILEDFLKGDSPGLCLDTGHGNISGQTSEILNRMAEKIKSVHVSDNYAKEDEHNPVGEGTVSWGPVIKMIKDRNIPVVHEIHRRDNPERATLKSRAQLEKIAENVSRETS